MPLSVNSAHAMHVHRSWPNAVMGRLTTLAQGQPELGKEILQHTINKYAASNACKFTLAVMARHLGNLSRPHNIHTNSQYPDENPNQSHTLWLRFNSHPLWARCFPSLSQKVQPPGGRRRLRFCWKNRMPNLGAVIAKANYTKSVTPHHSG